MKTPLYAKSLLLCLVMIIGSPMLFGQSGDNQDFKLAGKNPVTLVISQIITETTEILPFQGKVPDIFGLALTGEIVLNNDKSLVRIVLVDADYREHLVYEMYPLLSENQVIPVNELCEETALLNGLKPHSLRVEIRDASLSLNSLTYAGTVDPGLNVPVLKKQKHLAQNLVKIDRLNKQLTARGLSWVAGPTGVSELSYAERKSLFGNSTFPAGIEYYCGGVLQAGDGLKSATASLMVDAWDWRNRHGVSWVTKVTDQANCGSCWAFGATGATEAAVNLFFNQPIFPDLSEQDVLSCSGAGSCSGGYPYWAMDYIRRTGVVDEAAFPYEAEDLSCALKSTTPQQLIKIGGTMSLGSLTYPKSEDNLKKMIIRYGPVCGTVNDWSHALTLVGWQVVKAGDYFYYRDRYGTIKWITVASGSTLIGKTVWLYKNSWGSDWGDQGYLYLESAITNLGADAPVSPVTSLIQDYSVVSQDRDGDGFYWWGVGPKPSNCPPCPATPDGDDSNAALGPLDEYGKFITVQPDYCSSAGNVFTTEWIARVQSGGFSNPSGKSGYSDFTGLSIPMVVGTNSITLTPGFLKQLQNEYWRVWIDFNSDKDFSDTGEQVLTISKKKTAVTGSIIIPAGVSGEMRMRIAMKRGSAATACEIFAYGEVEDYTVSIPSSPLMQSGIRADLIAAQDLTRELKIYPNPACDQLTIEAEELTDQNELVIYSMDGRLLYREQITANVTVIDVSKWDSGIYLIRFNCGNRVFNQKFVRD